MAVTFCPVMMVTPASRAARSSASTTSRARSLTGHSLPVSSHLRGTPKDAKKSMVSETSKDRKTLAMALRLPLKSAAVTTSCVTLHRPPPEMRILAPIFGAASSATTRAPARPAKIAAISPAAPAPTTATSNVFRSSFNIQHSTFNIPGRYAANSKGPRAHRPSRLRDPPWGGRGTASTAAEKAHLPRQRPLRRRASRRREHRVHLLRLQRAAVPRRLPGHDPRRRRTEPPRRREGRAPRRDPHAGAARGAARRRRRTVLHAGHRLRLLQESRGDAGHLEPRPDPGRRG